MSEQSVSRRRFLTQAVSTMGTAMLPAIWSPRLFAEDPRNLSAPVEILKNGPSDKRINLLIVGYGWEGAEAKFHEFIRKTIIEDGLKSRYDALKSTFPFLNLSAAVVLGSADPIGLKIKSGAIGGIDKQGALRIAEQLGASMVYAVINDANITGYSMPDVAAGPTQITTLFHEWGHAFGQADEDLEDPNNYEFLRYFQLNIDRLATSDVKPRWQPALDQRVPGVKTNSIPGTRKLFRGDEQPCMMFSNGDKRGKQFGPVCALGIYLNARRRIGLLESATDDSTPVSVAKGRTPAISLRFIPSGAGLCNIQSWWTSGDPAEMDDLAKKLREERPGREDLTSPRLQATVEKSLSKSLRKFEFVPNNKTRTLDARTSPPVGSHLVIVVATDPTPGIFLDPEKVTILRKVYRVDVLDK